MGRPRKLTDHDLRELHAEGLTDIEIAEIMGVTIKAVIYRRKALGLPKNQPIGAPRKLTDHDFIELYNEGLIDVEIAEIMGVCFKTVNKRRKALGLPKNEQHCRTAWVFRVCDPDTKALVMEGTAREISKELYISTSLVRWYAKQTATGGNRRYDVLCVSKGVTENEEYTH